jgi:hypothetical protein|tara:strand:- start:1236 stop:1628 length:393 start_codon:yes stop_codon:yes gene_type:complete
MAAVNIVNVTSIYGKTTYYTPTGTAAVVLLPNAAASSTVMKIGQITATNTTGTAANTTVSVYTNGAVAQGSAPSGGTAYPIAGTISVPANAALIVSDKTTSFYLEEGVSISITSGTASAITYVVSYELMA